MITEINNWYIVDVYQDQSFEQSMGKVLWGIIINDQQGRFEPGDFVCTSRLLEIRVDEREVYTRTGSIYTLNGPGEQVRLTQDDLAIISKGVSPLQLVEMRQ